jgi:hypothetical protein
LDSFFPFLGPDVKKINQDGKAKTKKADSHTINNRMKWKKQGWHDFSGGLHIGCKQKTLPRQNQEQYDADNMGDGFKDQSLSGR